MTKQKQIKIIQDVKDMIVYCRTGMRMCAGCKYQEVCEFPRNSGREPLPSSVNIRDKETIIYILKTILMKKVGI